MNKSHAPDKLELTALRDFPLVQTGDKLPELIGDSLRANNLRPLDHDVLVIAQKIVPRGTRAYCGSAGVSTVALGPWGASSS